MRGDFYFLMPLATRAAEYTDSLSERNQLRIASTLASVRTDGKAAAEAASRILELDSTDFGAWTTLAYYHTVYGWQYGTNERDAAVALDRALDLDSTHVPSIVRRASLALQAADGDAVRRYLSMLRATDTTTVLARGTLLTHRALTIPDAGFDAYVDTLADYTPRDWRAVLGALRRDRPDRAELLLERLEAQPGPGTPVSALQIEAARLAVAEGRWNEVISGIEAGAYADPLPRLPVARLTVAASIAGLADNTTTAALVDELHTYVPPDSALAYWGQRPVWWNGWIVGAYHAMVGDTNIAVQWQRVFPTLPAGGTSRDYRAALARDLDARMLARRGDLDGARAAARDAYDLWTIHTDNTLESNPEPAIRFHYAMLLAATGRPDSGEAMLRSLVPPTAWLGFYTSRASFELGRLAEARGDAAAAAHNYAMALRLWDRGNQEIEDWRAQARDGLRRVTSEGASRTR
jgi:hypothetical protein